MCPGSVATTCYMRLGRTLHFLSVLPFAVRIKPFATSCDFVRENFILEPGFKFKLEHHDPSFVQIFPLNTSFPLSLLFTCSSSSSILRTTVIFGQFGISFNQAEVAKLGKQSIQDRKRLNGFFIAYND